MKRTYRITGMSCNGCRQHVEETLAAIEAVDHVEVNLHNETATVSAEQDLNISVLRNKLESEGGNYGIEEFQTNINGKIVEKYDVHGMTCNGCKMHVQKALGNLDKIDAAEVDLHHEEAILEMKEPVSLKELQNALEEAGGNYTIHIPGTERPVKKISEVKKSAGNGKGVWYCPMHCEGDKTYEKPGDCPVCGMDLVEEVNTNQKSVEFTCPMHPEVSKDEPGDCPICGMDLVPKQPEPSAEEKGYKKLLRKFWIAIGFTLPIFIIAMSDMVPNNPLKGWFNATTWNWIQFGLSLPVVFYACWMFFQRAWRSIVTWNLNMFTLIGIGAGVAWIFSVFGMLVPDFFPVQFRTESGTVHVYFEAATVILTLVLMGQVLEARAHSKTNSAIKELLKLQPNTALRIKDGKEEKISTSKIEKGDLLRIKPGDKIPVDGKISEGKSSIDESMISGEPVPVDKMKGDEVRSGTINGNQSFIMQAEKVGDDTLLAQIIKMVNEASRSQAPIQKLADKISGYFVPVVVIISVITFIVWSIFGPEPQLVYALVNAIAVLIIACPCALGLATPMSVMVGIGRGAGNGILIKNAKSLERLNKVDTLIIDKTGTLTEGKPSVDKVVSVSSEYTSGRLTAIIASLNTNSEHPLAQATVDYAEKHEIELIETSDFKSETGKGVTGTFKESKVLIGNKALMDSNNIQIPSDVAASVSEEQQRGNTVSYVAINAATKGYVVITDKIKEGTKKVISDLQNHGIDVIMISGDHKNTAAAVASEIGIKNYKAGMLPHHKLEEVEKLQKSGKIVAVAGDGINDAPALARADVGIAMGTGTDVAIESAALTLVNGDLRSIRRAILLSQKVMRNIKENLFFALIYNTVGVPIAAGVLYPLFGILLSPMIAALAMSFSSFSVIANALRLKSADLKD
ncbi:heavy metal translocating P-type ATPase [uncultured Christiangramia sp.]|uniref:heavy metal translocating P-type ATPase n=1 Tax=Christiangramia sp. 3-2217-3z TaxID=3417564 RepID=UPI0026074945|nr:heavy metal translocating P-type ATPase [uncultured Christiangramia sp.]